MDAFTLLLLGGTGVIWTGILSVVVAYAKHRTGA
jgi:hypothetical protein